MSLRSTIGRAACKNIEVNRLSLVKRTNRVSSGRFDHQSSPKAWSPLSLPLVHWRGAKTKTVIKANDLPQGGLPPLPPDPSDDVPTKAYPPVLQQHLNNIRKFPECVILTRVGDFYELYFDQVEQYAPLLNLKKAKRKTALGDVPMSGFQYLQLDRYLKVLVHDHGLKVAISEQIPLRGEERTSKGGPMYDRRVTRVITAGTLVDESFVDPYENNHLLAVHVDGVLPPDFSTTKGSEIHERYTRATNVGLSWVDLSSGSFYTQVSDLAKLPSLVARIGPREVVLSGSLEHAGEAKMQNILGDGMFSVQFHAVKQPAATVSEWSSMLERPIAQPDEEAFTKQELAAGSIVLDYVRDKLLDNQIQLQPPIRRSDDEYLAIDTQSLRGLEIKSTLRDGLFTGSLLHTIRRTVTKSGARLLSQRLVSPSTNLSTINNRLDLLEEMLNHSSLQEDTIALLRQTSDTLRLVQRFSIGKGDADDLLSLAQTIDLMRQMAGLLHDHIISNQDDGKGVEIEHGFLWDILSRLDLEEPGKVAKAIVAAIDEEGLNRKNTAELESREEVEDMAEEVTIADEAGEKAPRVSKRASKTKIPPPAEISTNKVVDTSAEDIWIMRRNASPTLERAHSDLGSLLVARENFLIELRRQTGAESLSLKWTPQNGHFCHVKGRDAQRSLSGLDDARVISAKKTTKTFYLTQWTRLGTQIDDSKLRIRTEEERVFKKLSGRVIENLMKLRRNAMVLDELDVACSSAVLAKERGLIRPILNNSTYHKIIGGRHPTVDIGLEEVGRSFTSNDCSVGDQANIHLITGPNMGGKSTYLRQNALITILAQTGCFVPAEYAEIGIVDKIFSRVGSADNLYQGKSTFMIEMEETAQILTQATERSFVIMDEVGRGTTPEAGVAIGYACLDHLHRINKCRTLFATHFHKLADMTAHFDSVGYFCTDLSREGDEWTYMHKLKRGVNRESHALKVAELAYMPKEAISVAAEMLAGVQQNKGIERGPDKIAATG